MKLLNLTLTVIIIGLIFSSNAVSAKKLEQCQTEECKAYFEKFKVSSKRGHPVAVATLGQFYYYGYGTEPNENEALRLFLKASRQGNTAAKYKAGVIYLTSEKNKDIEKGISYLERAAKKHYKNANFYLGIIHLSEDFGSYDVEKADKYLSIAYKEENDKIPEVIDTIKQSTPITQESFPQLFEQMHEAPLVESGGISEWPNDGTEIITVTSPPIEEIFDDLLISFRKPKKSLGTRFKGKTCEDIVSCVGSDAEGFEGLVSFPFVNIR